MATNVLVTSPIDDTGFQPVIPRRPVEDEAEMDITPMIDITFLLLIFFLVASRPDATTAIDLPNARYGKGVSQRESVIFSVDEGVARGSKDHSPIYLGDGRHADSELVGTTKQQADRIESEVRKSLYGDPPRSHVIIKAAKGVPYREVARVAAAASRVDGIHLHFAVMESE